MDWKQLISTVAPWIGTALGSPLGGVAVSSICDALGLSDKSEDAIKQDLSGTTLEQLLALKKADQEFQIKMQELGFTQIKDLEMLAVQDRGSARKREIEVKDNTPKILAYSITGTTQPILNVNITPRTGSSVNFIVKVYVKQIS